MSFDPVAQSSELTYGKVVSEAYAFTPTSIGKRDGEGKRDGTGDIYFNACLANGTLCTSPGAQPVVSLSYSQLSDGDIGPYPLEL